MTEMTNTPEDDAAKKNNGADRATEFTADSAAYGEGSIQILE